MFERRISVWRTTGPESRPLASSEVCQLVPGSPRVVGSSEVNPRIKTTVVIAMGLCGTRQAGQPTPADRTFTVPRHRYRPRELQVHSLPRRRGMKRGASLT
jgi:hypothetical protein